MVRAREGDPLIPGGYAGPIRPDVKKPPAFTRNLPDWIVGILLPPLIFAPLAVLQGYYKRNTEVDVDAVVVCVVLLAFFSAIYFFRRGRTVLVVHSVLCLLAGIVGALAGYTAFYTHFDIAFQFHSLVTYVNIDPAKDVGGAYMDAGEVYFKEGSRVDTNRGIAVVSKDVYCAAPVVREEVVETAADASGAKVHPPPAGTIDWWAIGVNCCQPSGEGFTCGLNVGAGSAVPRAGMRLLRDYERHLYRLAVDEWTSKYELPVNHPLFFEWVADPLADVTNHVISGWQMLVVWIEVHAAVNFIIATIAISVVVELGL